MTDNAQHVRPHRAEPHRAEPHRAEPDAPDPISPRALRDAAGCFATGVTIVTTRNADGRAIGLTANSFSSLSLDPPLVLWSLGKQSRAAQAFVAAEHFAIHVLGENQRDLAERFAAPVPDRFAGLDQREGHGGVPAIAGCPVRLDCRIWSRVDGGDHHIFIGYVVGIDTLAQQDTGLVFLRGRFGTWQAAANRS